MTKQLVFDEQEIGVQTDKNGFITEEGLVAFYRDFGNLGEDLEASGVSKNAEGRKKTVM